MSTRRITLDIPVSVFRQLSTQAKLTDKSIEKVAEEAIASSLPLLEQKIPKRDEILAIIAAHREKLQAMGVKSLQLFGSVARDEATVDSSEACRLFGGVRSPSRIFKIIRGTILFRGYPRLSCGFRNEEGFEGTFARTGFGGSNSCHLEKQRKK